MLGILGKKGSMTQVFKDDGKVIPVTSIIAGPCFILQIKNTEKDGYKAAQIGFDDKKASRTTKARAGHCKKSNATAKKFVKEIALADDDTCEVGQKIELDIFQEGDFVDVTGVSIGKGFQGGMKRYGWSGGRGRGYRRGWGGRLITLRRWRGGRPLIDQNPVIVSVGIGGTAERTLMLAKRATLRRVGETNPDAEVAELEKEILQRVNNLGIGPMGYGGRVTALAVHIEVFPAHIASLPVAVNLLCHSARHKEAIL